MKSNNSILIILGMVAFVALAAIVLFWNSQTDLVGEAKGGASGSRSTTQCSDCIDNDGDGLVDTGSCSVGSKRNNVKLPADPGCYDKNDDNEFEDTVCGNSIVEPGESCDSNSPSCNFNGYTGSKNCLQDCSGYSSCVSNEFCGDSLINGPEVCDSSSRSCNVDGYVGTELCKRDCSGYDLCSSSQFCGDSNLNGYEQCDDGNHVDDDGCSSTCIVESLENLVPVIDVFTDSLIAPFTVLFNAYASTGAIARYEWNFNDTNDQYDSTDEGRMVGHRFDNPGSYEVVLTVYDAAGNSATAKKVITVLAPPQTAKTYYISVLGDDSNDGRSENTPWKTINKVIGVASSIPDGSKVLFRKGDVFIYSNSAPFYNTDYISLANLLRPKPYYIMVGSYGSGALPVFLDADGSTKLSGETASSNKGMIIDGIKVYGTIYSRTKDLMNPGHQLIIRNSEFNFFQMWGAHGTIMENVKILSPGGSSIGILGNHQPWVPNSMEYFYANNIFVTGAGSHCIYMSGGGYHMLIENSELSYCGIGSTIRDAFTTHGLVGNMIIRNNDIHDNGFAFGLDSALYDQPAQSGDEYWGTVQESIEDFVIEGNRIYNQKNFVMQARSLQNLIFRNNLVYDNEDTTSYVFTLSGPKADPGPVDKSTQNLQFYNNVFRNNKATGRIFQMGEDTFSSNSVHNDLISNLIIINNIFDANVGKVVEDIRGNKRSQSDDIVLSNNLFFQHEKNNEVLFIGQSYSVNSWINTTDPSSLHSNPLFVNPSSNDFRLQSSSPAKDRGLKNVIFYDANGDLRDAFPDMGAFESS